MAALAVNTREHYLHSCNHPLVKYMGKYHYCMYVRHAALPRALNGDPMRLSLYNQAAYSEHYVYHCTHFQTVLPVFCVPDSACDNHRERVCERARSSS
eukprot:284669-Rhodomonas_salina.1